MNLYIIIDNITNSYKTAIIPLLSMVCIIFAIFTVINKNPVISILNLIGLFVSVAIYLMLLGLYFLGLSYLLVYVGAVSILFIFILMLINIRTSELLTEGRNSMLLAIIVLLTMSFAIGYLLPENDLYYSTYDFFKHLSTSNYTDNNQIFNMYNESWEKEITEMNHITSIGNTFYTNYSILLIMLGLLLLVAIVGAIVITSKKTIRNL